jgi:preprotein translocase subunit SecG
MVLGLLVASAAVAQVPSKAPPTQTSGSGSMTNMPMMQSGQGGGMMQGCPAMRGGQCPMMGGMGMASMMTMMILANLFLIAAIFALIALGVFLLRRSRPAVTQ